MHRLSTLTLLSSLLQILDSLFSGWLLSLGIGAMGQPISHPLEGISDPVSHV
jgi:hypothetical protein